MVHKLVQGSEEVKLAFDVLASGLELKEVRYYFEDLLDDFGLSAPQAVLDMVDAKTLNENIHEAVMVGL